MLSSIFCNNIQLKCQLVVPPYILTINLQLETTGRQSSQHYYRKYTKNITMGNKEQVNQEGGNGTDQIQTRYR